MVQPYRPESTLAVSAKDRDVYESQPLVGPDSGYVLSMKLGRLLFFVSYLSYLLITGCTQQQPMEPDSSPAPTPIVVEPEPEKTPPAATRAFPRETLYSLLAAEIAGSRDQFDVALNNYAQQAKQTRDPQVAERATMIARFMRDNKTAMETALLWVEVAPESDEALANASMTLMQNGRLTDAFEMSRRLLERNEETLFQSIAAVANTSTEAEQAELLQKYQALLETYPENEQLLVGTGLLLQMHEQHTQALEYAQTALTLNARSVPAAILEANLLQQLNRDDEAIARMTSLLEYQPDNIRLRLQYARLLTRHDLGLAQEQFEILTEQSPRDGDMLLSLGIIALERDDIPTATNAFEQLLDEDQHISTAHYYLGKIAESESKSQIALIHYLQVVEGSDFLSATINLLNILIGQGDLLSASEHMARLHQRLPDQSEKLDLIHAQILVQHHHLEAAERALNKALKRNPASAENTELLYARAMLHDKKGDLAATERDLRKVIALKPGDAMALNSLGYILLERTQRIEDARTLLLQAIAIDSDDPAIIDSLGWLYFKTGDYPEALVYLRKAYAAYPDGEIAAHLGEVLWTVGEHDEALKIWQDALKLAPDNEVVRSTMQRLKADQ